MVRDAKCEDCGLNFVIQYWVEGRNYECPSCNGGNVVFVFDDWKDGVDS